MKLFTSRKSLLDDAQDLNCELVEGICVNELAVRVMDYNPIGMRKVITVVEVEDITTGERWRITSE